MSDTPDPVSGGPAPREPEAIDALRRIVAYEQKHRPCRVKPDGCGECSECIAIFALRKLEGEAWMTAPARCEICDWPLAASQEGGCVPGNCAYRPRDGSPEWHRIRARRAALRAVASRPGGRAPSEAWTYCPICGKVLVHLTPENRGIRPLPGIGILTEHADGTPLCRAAALAALPQPDVDSTKLVEEAFRRLDRLDVAVLPGVMPSDLDTIRAALMVSRAALPQPSELNLTKADPLVRDTSKAGEARAQALAEAEGAIRAALHKWAADSTDKRESAEEVVFDALAAVRRTALAPQEKGE